MSNFFKHKGITHPKLDRYVLDHTTPESPLMSRLFRDTYVKMHHPRRTSDHLIGKFLEMICRMIGPEKVLEIGTFTGYGALAMAAGLPEGAELHTIEINDELEPLISGWINESPDRNKIHLHIGNALSIIPDLNISFDLVFIDGEKDQYIDYYEAALKIMRPGGFLIADNTLWSGKVLEADVPENDHFTRGIMRFNDHVQADGRVENLLLPVFDGIMVIRVK
ncbi:MAG: O-methyltransferase [Bacteroidia bacterium]|nr:O-methyltransferase [Bacteroidia bacterium]